MSGPAPGALPPGNSLVDDTLGGDQLSSPASAAGGGGGRQMQGATPLERQNIQRSHTAFPHPESREVIPEQYLPSDLSWEVEVCTSRRAPLSTDWMSPGRCFELHDVQAP